MKFINLNFTAFMVVAFLALCASAKNDGPKKPVYHPVRPGRGIELNRNVNVSQALLNETAINHPDCTFHDGHGDVRCNLWSFVYDINGGGSLFITGAGWFERFDVGCELFGYKEMSDKDKKKLDIWFHFKAEQLDWQFALHPGNACLRIVDKGLFDNVWIEYVDLFINTPDSPRCSRVGPQNFQQRCLIPLRP